jgi:hypothetical protein
MDPTSTALLRLASQQLVGTKFSTPQEIVGYMGAMQAQDYPMARWAVGTRLPRAAESEVKAAIANAQIIRTHLVRPTWHFVASQDIYWMLDLTASHVKAAQSARERQLELTPQVFSKSNRVIETTLADGLPRTRDELIHALQIAGIPTDQNRASHLLARAEADQIICSGPDRDNKPTYALLSQRVPVVNRLSHQEALAELATRYFTSRSPASLQDFTWWSGLPARDAAHALDLVKTDYNAETMANRTYWYSPETRIARPAQPSAFLLPTYDEFTISYTDRSASIDPGLEQHMKQISNRGVFRPIVVVGGQVVGIWKRAINKNGVTVEVQPFSRPDPGTEGLIRAAAGCYATFLGQELEFSLSDR